MKIIIFVMSAEMHHRRREVLRRLLEKLPFEFEFMSIDDDIELTPDAVEKNHDSKRTIDSFGRDFNRGELASTLNHLLAYKNFLNSQNNVAIILEDDATFSVDTFNRVVNDLLKKIDENKPQVYLLTPVISYLDKNSTCLVGQYKVSEVVQSWDASGYIINRSAATQMLSINAKSWIIADDWVKYKKYANINLFSVIPPIIRQDLIEFESNLMKDRKVSTKTRGFKYIFSRNKNKVISDIKKYLWLIPFKGYVRNKDV